MHIIQYLFLPLLIGGVSFPPSPASPAPIQSDDSQARRKQLNDLLAEQWEYTLRTNPDFASVLGDKRWNDKLSDNSYKFVIADLKTTEEFLKRFEAIDTNGFPEQEKLNKLLMVRSLKETLDGSRFKPWEMPVSQFIGIHIDLPQLVSMLSFKSVKDYEDYIARLKAVPLAFDQTTDLMRMGMQSGRIPPRIILDQVAKQASGIANTPVDHSPFFEPANKFPSEISLADQKRLREAILSEVTHSVMPTYQRFTKFVTEEYAPKGRIEPGAWSLPDGDAYYAFRVKQSTTTEMTPQQIHEVGLQQVSADRAEMLKIAKTLGYSDLKSMEVAVKANPALHPKSREQMLELYRKYNDEMWTKLPELFGTLPKAKVIVMPVEEFREKQASGAQYSGPSLDGSRPGRIMVNTGDFAKRSTVDIETTAYHEGVPGHHLQIAVSRELSGLPEFRKEGNYTAFAEGWGLYSERLGKDVGFFTDPNNDYGRLQMDLLRAIRLVVDTGFHYKHWSRQQVIDYFHQNSGIDEPTVQSETDRYIAWPAQALGYKVGQLKFLELRTKAQKELGDKFDIRAFHDTIIDGGGLPLDIVQLRVEQWIQSRKTGMPAGSGQ